MWNRCWSRCSTIRACPGQYDHENHMHVHTHTQALGWTSEAEWLADGLCLKQDWTPAGMWGCERGRGPGSLCRIHTQGSLTSAPETSQEHNSKDLIESPTVTLTWHASKDKVHKPYQRHIFSGSMLGQNIPNSEVKGRFILRVRRRFRLEEDWAKMKWKESRN